MAAMAAPAIMTGNSRRVYNAELEVGSGIDAEVGIGYGGTAEVGTSGSCAD